MLIANNCLCQSHQNPVREPKLRVRAVAKRIAAPAGSPPALHWVAEPFPSASDLVIANQDFRQKLADVLARLARGGEGCPVWVLENSNDCTLSEKLARELREFHFQVNDDPNLLNAPEEEGKVLDLTLSLQFQIPVPQPIHSLEVQLSTINADKGTAVITKHLSTVEAAQTTGTPIPAPELLGASITINSAEEDRKRPESTAFTLDQLEKELFRVGLNCLDIAFKKGLAPGRIAPPDDQQLTLIEDAIQEVYRVERPPWTPVKVDIKRNDRDYTITVIQLQFVAQAKIEVVRGQIIGSNGPVDFDAETEKGRQKLTAILTKATERVQAAVNAGGHTLEGTIPTRASVGELGERISKLPFVRPPVDVQCTGSTMAFQPVYNWVDSDLDAQFRLQVAFDPEQLFTGTGKLHGHNLLYLPFRNHVDRGVGESWDLDITGGTEVQKANLNLSVAHDISVSTNHLFTFGPNLLLFFSQDRNQRLGSLPAFRSEDLKAFHLIDQERGINPKVFLQYGHSGAWKHRIRWEGGLDWRHVLVRPQSRLLPARADGQLTAWDNSVQEQLWHDVTPLSEKDPGSGLGEFTIYLNGTLRLGRRQLAGDYDFWRPRISASAEALGGWRTRRELLLRHEWGVAFASAGTPIFQLPRLGGSDSVRGIEEGEFIGRSLRYQQTTAGVGLPVLWPSVANLQGQAAVLAHTYLTVFYDRGRVEQDHVSHFANGYGVAAELRNLPAGKQRVHLSIGWARSPQSVLHHKGVITMRVRFDF